ncbi:prolyl oligopeptidase family serine peptidase, partial [Corynebacterium diphtheriae]|uniref:prolyl oligopeptidase family serine peptidase n=1 Tax=Corynebacterium diphtheriae TaxID=1717 RepID=UPI003909C73B
AVVPFVDPLTSMLMPELPLTGKTVTKKNTFTDFIAVADHLVEHGVATSTHFRAHDTNADGTHMGSVANMAGDRFKAIEAVVPFVDPLTSMLMPELPLTGKTVTKKNTFTDFIAVADHLV